MAKNNMTASRISGAIVWLVSIANIQAMSNSASGEAIKVISPPSTATAEGDSSITPSRNPLRIQYLIPASDFAGLPPSNRHLVAFNFRADSSQTQPVDWTIPHERIWMSTTSRNSLTTVFDDNHGSNKTLVFDGTMQYPFIGTGPAAGPRDFANGRHLQTPFYYDPAQGNLLIELRDLDKNYPVPAAIDLVTIPSSNIRTLLNDGNANAAAGTPVPNIVAPMQFEFAVPEPSAFALAGVTLVCSIVSRRKRR
jgi:hypothetical protein